MQLRNIQLDKECPISTGLVVKRLFTVDLNGTEWHKSFILKHKDQLRVSIMFLRNNNQDDTELTEIIVGKTKLSRKKTVFITISCFVASRVWNIQTWL